MFFPAPEREVFCSDLSVNAVLSFSFTVPGVPQSVSVTSPSSTSLLVTWDHPLAPDRNGVITNYTVLRQTGIEMNTIEPARYAPNLSLIHI